VAYADYVGDDPQRITQTLQRAFASGDVVFSFGGIGATPDDHTRQCAAQATDQALVLHPEARPLILERCRQLAEQEGPPFDADSPDTHRRLQMGFFPVGASIIPNPFNGIPGFSLQGRVHFVPGFPVMAWPMMAWVLDTLHSELHGRQAMEERAVVVYGAIESVLTPLMVEIEAEHAPIKVFSLPSLDHPEHGRHIELGVKGPAGRVEAAYIAMKIGLSQLGAKIGPETVRTTGA
jgi:molybdopterin-biosynthesis enzyme MoeA-like protein